MRWCRRALHGASLAIDLGILPCGLCTNRSTVPSCRYFLLQDSKGSRALGDFGRISAIPTVQSTWIFFEKTRFSLLNLMRLGLDTKRQCRPADLPPTFHLKRLTFLTLPHSFCAMDGYQLLRHQSLPHSSLRQVGRGAIFHFHFSIFAAARVDVPNEIGRMAGLWQN